MSDFELIEMEMPKARVQGGGIQGAVRTLRVGGPALVVTVNADSKMKSLRTVISARNYLTTTGINIFGKGKTTVRKIDDTRVGLWRVA